MERVMPPVMANVSVRVVSRAMMDSR
jgi:hypothetical protein